VPPAAAAEAFAELHPAAAGVDLLLHILPADELRRRPPWVPFSLFFE